jgi:hypothetical protein
MSLFLISGRAELTQTSRTDRPKLAKSSAHAETTYDNVKFTEIDTAPEIELPQNFWNSLIRYNSRDRSYYNEAHVTLFTLELAQAIMYGLELNCKAVPQVQKMDIIPDLSFWFSNNLLPSLNWEDKKGIGEKIWKNDSSVAGQVFEQLLLTKCGIGGAVYGILSTYNGVKIVSTEDWTKVPPAVLQQNLTPDKCLPSVDPRATASQASAAELNPLEISSTAQNPPKVRIIPKLIVDKDAPRTPKKTRISVLNLKREFSPPRCLSLESRVPLIWKRRTRLSFDSFVPPCYSRKSR